ncbi:hypothetical protein [Candidatus Uabimicrobium sp. HlEnr_7]|uniref:hypothetical protein n=1 Tax=Candidatus Uabimicrobium helgolandensis TaxID=3095367 RepID=UPI003558F47F
MWYKIDKGGFSKEELIRLYSVIETRTRGFREDLFRFTNFYSAVCFAILGITLSGFVNSYDKGFPVLFFLFGPITTIFMCFLGLRVTNQIYRRIQQETSMKAKIENALGLDQEIPLVRFYGSKTIWEEDNSVIPTRHAERRFLEPDSSGFVDAGSRKKGGVNKNNKLYFGIIGLVSIILIITIVAFALKQG